MPPPKNTPRGPAALQPGAPWRPVRGGRRRHSRRGRWRFALPAGRSSRSRSTDIWPGNRGSARTHWPCAEEHRRKRPSFAGASPECYLFLTGVARAQGGPWPPCHASRLRMLQAEQLIERIKAYQPNVDSRLVQRAYDFSFSACTQGRPGKSGQPYIVHPVSVAGIIADLKLDGASVCAGLLHDVIEDTLKRRPDDITKEFRPGGGRAGRRGHQALEDQLHLQGGPPGRELPQDGGGHGAGHPRLAHQALRPPRQHADARAHEARGPGAHRPGDPRDLRPAREPPRHPVVQERARGSLVQVPRARALQRASRADDADEAQSATSTSPRCARRSSETASPSEGFAAEETAAPSTSTASTAR